MEMKIMVNINQRLRQSILGGKAIIKFVDIVNTSLDESVLQVEKEAQFVQALQEASPMLDEGRFIGMKSSKKDIDRVEMEIDLEDGSRNSSTGVITLTDQDPDFYLNQLDAEKLMAKFRLTYEAIEDNIEGEGIQNTLAQLFGKACGRSLERIFIYGDTDLTPGVNIPSGYAVIDGWITKADSDQVLDSGDFSATDVETVLEEMIDAYDASYLNPDTVFWVAQERITELRRALKSKDTELGDRAVEENGELKFEGVPLKRVPALSKPLQDADFAANISEEVLFLGNRKNFVHGLRRGITIESDKDIENQIYKFIASLRGDCHFENETKVVVGRPSTT